MALLAAATLVSDYLGNGIASSDATTLAVLGRALQRAEDLLARRIGFPGAAPTLASGSYTLRVEASRNNTRRLLVPIAPIASFTTIHQDLDVSFGSDTLIASTDYEAETLNNGTYLHLLPTGTTAAWYTEPRSIKVVCVAGYATEAAIHDDLADAIYRTVADWWVRRQNRHISSVSAHGTSQSYQELSGPIPKDVEQQLADWTFLGQMGVS